MKITLARRSRHEQEKPILRCFEIRRVQLTCRALYDSGSFDKDAIIAELIDGTRQYRTPNGELWDWIIFEDSTKDEEPRHPSGCICQDCSNE